jgi:hypothetical protein
MSGGQSHLDTWDPKPENKEVMGATKAINTSADGVQISEYLPHVAKHMHHACVINSVATSTGAHEQANYLMHTSFSLRSTIKHPGMGAWLSTFQGAGNPALPPSVYIGNDSRHPGAGFFAKKHGPLMLNNPEAGLQNVRMPKGVTEERFATRRDLANVLDADFQSEWQTRNVKAYSDAYDDELPYWNHEHGRPHLVIPYTLVNNDVRFQRAAITTGDDFHTYIMGAIEMALSEPGSRMLTVGLHNRIIGHPARAIGLKRILDAVKTMPEVWVCRRLDIARHWMENHAP